MKGYKVFNPDWTCRDMQYAVGQEYEMDKEPELCQQGFHFCEQPNHCIEYYNVSPRNKFAIVEAAGKIVYTSSKCATNRIKIVRELSFEQFIKQCADCIGIPSFIVTKDVIVPGGVTSVGSWAFEKYCNANSVLLPDSVESIREYAFDNCRNMTTINIPDSVTRIGQCAFYNCHSLTSVNIPNNIKVIYDATFAHCGSLTSVDIPEGIVRIDEEAFAYCLHLNSVTIPDSVTSIGDRAFHNCNLTSVMIPRSVIRISDSAFDPGVEIIRR